MTAYNMPQAIRLEGNLDVQALEQAFDELFRRHEILRTRFIVEEGVPLQVIAPISPFSLPCSNWQGKDQLSLNDYIEAHAGHVFDLSIGSLLKVELLKVASDNHILLLNLHHIISDGWSMGILFKELSVLYAAGVQGIEPLSSVLPPLPIQYKDYAAWQNGLLASEGIAPIRQYWLDKLAPSEGQLPVLDLPADYPRPAIKTFKGNGITTTFSPMVVKQLERLSQSRGVTLFMSLTALVKVLLYRYTGQKDLLVGTPIAGRSHPDLYGQVGFYVNTLVLRNQIAPKDTFEDLLKKVKASSLEAFENESYPFDRLVDELGLPRDISRFPVFDVMMVLQNNEEAGLQLEGLEISQEITEWGISKFDLTFEFATSPKGLHVLVEYSADLFKADRIERLISHLKCLINSVLAKPDGLIDELNILPTVERAILLADFNDTRADFSTDATIIDLFEKQVEKTPDHIAVVPITNGKEGEPLTYRQLNEKANEVGHYLRDTYDIKPDDIIALQLERSEWMMVALLGVMKAGAAYLPIDPGTPENRVEYMLQDSRAKALLADEPTYPTAKKMEAVLPVLSIEKIKKSKEGNPVKANSSKHLAYIIYTSGSTGQPKGVMIEHHSISNYLQWANKTYFKDSPKPSMGLLSPIAFDMALTTLFCPLLRGSRLYVYGTNDIGNLLETAFSSNTPLEAIKLTPSHIDLLAGLGLSTTAIQTVILGGEALQSRHISLLYGLNKNMAIYNEYGPTEATVGCSVQYISSSDADISIGKPIANTDLYILDNNLAVVPIGIAGELYIGGFGLARAYLNNPELTAEKFIPHPFKAGERLYKTGDLARWLPDGDIAFLGRIDNQLKIRGYRIEAGEIEHALLQHPAVKNAAVIGTTYDNDQALVAYIVSEVAEVDTDSQDQILEEYLENWQNVFDSFYEEETEVQDLTLDLAGWDSSYTQAPIPAEEMKEWVEHTASRIKALHPSRVLEIGVGTGMFLARIAPLASQYFGIDVSKEVVEKINRLQQAYPELAHARVLCHAAHDLLDIEKQSLDTIIINSVIQYFPNQNYLEEVLIRSKGLLEAGGHLFIGDVRSFPLLKAFYAEVKLFQLSDSTSQDEFSRALGQAIKDEKELTIDPFFFYHLQEHAELHLQVDMELKKGAFWNELTQYRYDVTLRVGKPSAECPVQWQDWEEGKWALETVNNWLKKDNHAILGLKNIPNSRIQKGIEALKWVNGQWDCSSVAEFRAALQNQERGLNPESFWDLVENTDYEVKINWSADTESGAFDVAIIPPSLWKTGLNIIFPIEAQARLATRKELYCNIPIERDLKQELIKQLKELLAAELPEYMIPQYFLSLDALPLTSSGKINHKKLPKPDDLSLGSGESYVAPRNSVEQTLAAIWGKVLGRTPIGIHDNFFNIGGHSLRAIRLISLIQQQLSAKIKLTQIFAHPTIAELAPEISKLASLHPSLLPPIPRIAIQESYALSNAQRRLWVLDQMEENQVAYNMPAAFKLKGKLDIQALEQTINLLFQRHESLRTNFVEGRQLIHHGRNFTLEASDFTNASAEAIQAYIEAHAAYAFDLEKDSLWQLEVLKVSPSEHILLSNMHHIISDGWSIGVLVKEMSALYTACIQEIEQPLSVLPPLPIQYKDYAAWQNELLASEQAIPLRQYWLKQLAPTDGQLPNLELPADFPRPAIKTYKGANQKAVFSAAVLEQLNRLAQSQEATLFMILAALMKVLLHRYTGQKDLIIGTPTAGRSHPDLHGQIGFYVNTLVLRNEIEEEDSFEGFLQKVKTSALEAVEHEFYPFDRLVEELDLPRDMSRSPIFDILVVLQNNESSTLQLGDLDIDTEAINTNGNKFDLAFNFEESPNGLALNINYNTHLFKAPRIQRLISHLETLVECALENPGQAIKQLNILPLAEKSRLREFNATAVDYPKDKTITQLFEEQAAKTPDKIALVFEEKRLSYRELEEQSNRLANYLVSKGVKKGAAVAICVDPSADMIVAVLGILKSGGAYVPIDSDFPQRRIDEVLENVGARWAISTKAYAEQLNKNQAISLILLDEEWELIARTSGEKPETGLSTTDPIYIIHTSGSTGRPKGIQMQHGALVNLIHWKQGQFSNKSNRRVLQFSSITFDGSFLQIFSTLCFGSELYLLSKLDRKNPARMLEIIRDNHLTHIFFTYTVLDSLVQQAKLEEHYPICLEEVVSSGEILYLTEDLSDFLKRANATLINQFGPSETHVITSYEVSQTDFDTRTSALVGKPIDNMEIYIVDEAGNLCPIGIAGEIYAGGAQLAVGYHNNEALTAENFVPHPFKQGERVYKTGDLARWLPDGNIEFLGRIDHQLKIRGYRIEAGEVEQALLAHPAIQSAVVIGYAAEGSTSKELAAYLVARDAGQLPDIETLRNFLSEGSGGLGAWPNASALPDYMIPSYFVKLDSLPLTASGKVNRNALPAPDMASLALGTAYAPARNPIEKALVAIWEEVLGRMPIGIHDNFFSIGGHSLRAIRLVSLIHKQLSVKIKLTQAFAHPTIAELALEVSKLAGLHSSLLPPIPRIATQESYALSNAQRRLWVLDQIEENQIAYNMPAAFKLTGKLDLKALEQAIRLLFQRHEILRTNFVEGRQFIQSNLNFKLKVSDFTNAGAEAIQARIQVHATYAFNLEKDSLWRLEALKVSPSEHILLSNMHHIISDGWSMGILAKEMSALYSACIQEIEQPLSVLLPLPIQYKDYATWQNELLASEQAIPLRKYWLKKLVPTDGQLPNLELPSDYPRPAIKTHKGAGIYTLFNAAVLEKLEQLSRAQETTLFMSLTALVKVLFYRYTGQRDLLIGTPTAGRSHPDLHEQVGFYINTLVLRNQIAEEDTFEDFLQKVKINTLEAFEHEFYPFDRLVEELSLSRDMSRSPVFDVMLALQNNEEAGLQLEGLSISPEIIESDISKFDLAFNFAPSPEGLHLNVEYCTDLFKADRIQRLVNHLECLINSVLAKPDELIDELNILPDTEKTLILKTFNATQADLPADKTIIDLFEEQVKKTPDNVAVVFENKELTYLQLNEKANQLGHYLRENYHIQPDDIIALHLERSEWMIIAILGVMKSGAAYLPIDPGFPEARVEFMLRDSRAKVLLADVDTHAVVQKTDSIRPVLRVEKIKHEKNSNPVIINTPSNLAYIIYTSGSTGMPKGVMIEHSGIINTILCQIQLCDIQPVDHILQFAAYTFDASISEILQAVLSGATLVMTSQTIIHSPQKLLKQIETQLISVLTLPPAYLNTLDKSGLGGVRVLKSAGERPILEGASALSKGRKYINAYGPTENSVCTSIFEVPPQWEMPFIPIGKPIFNTEVFILNKEQKLLPIGIAGELCVSGAGLARGYLNQPELTDQRFIPHPFKAGERLYKTGDLARWLPDGNIEFLGRLDHQLKIRGHRIEAGEIEQALLQHPAIQAATVIGKEMGQGKELVAYLVPKELPIAIGIPDAESLRLYLSEQLPSYMIPSYFVELETLPLTTSGKVNRNALPGPEEGSLVSRTAYTAPRNSIETTLAGIWEEILEITPIGIYDNFFDLGGHSLRAIHLVAAIHQNFQIEYPLSLIFQYPTIQKMAKSITETEAHESKFHHRQGLCFNEHATLKVFAFPALWGLAVTYEQLAGSLPEVALHSFDFIQEEDRLETYYQQIKKYQPSGPYVFFGYSSGGNLAFEMARFMESKGEAVSDIIFGDSAIRLSSVPTEFDFNEYLKDVKNDPNISKEQSALLENKIVRKQTEQRISAYQHFLMGLKVNTVIQANIHQLLSEKDENIDSSNFSKNWQPFTKGNFKVYPARGVHGALFEPPNLSFNVAIMKKILLAIHQGMISYVDQT